MHDTIDTELDPDEAPAEAGSILGQLQQMRADEAAKQAPSRDFEVPGYDGALIVRYVHPAGGYKAAQKAARHELNRNDPDAQLNGSADLLIACCGSLLGVKDGKVLDLISDAEMPPHELPVAPLKFTEQLAQMFGFEVPEGASSPARYVCRSVFSPRGPTRGEWDGDMALIRQSNRVFGWLNKAEAEVDEILAGN
jgi:hypothetical protein